MFTNVPPAMMDSRIDRLNTMERCIYFSLLLSPKLHFTGVFPATIREIAFYTGISQPTVKKHLDAIAPLVQVDTEKGVAYIRDLLKVSRPDDKPLAHRHLTGAAAHLESIGPSPVILSFLLDNVDLGFSPQVFASSLWSAYPHFDAEIYGIDTISPPTEASFFAADMPENPTEGGEWGNIPHPADVEESMVGGESYGPLYIYTPYTQSNNLPPIHRDNPEIIAPPSILSTKPSNIGEGGCGGENLESGVCRERTLVKKLDPDSLLSLWNEMRPLDGNGRAVMTPERRKKMRLRLAFRPEREYWEGVFNTIKRNRFLRGEKNPERPWKATIDWLITNDTNHTKVFEGRYNSPDNLLPDGSSPQPVAKRRKQVCPHCKNSGWRLCHVEGKKEMMRVKCECRGGGDHATAV